MTRPILLLGGIYFGVFAIVAFTLQRFDASQTTLSIIGGVMAYGYLLTIAVIAFVRWRRAKGQHPPEAAGGR